MSEATVHCAIHPAVDGPRARRLAGQLLAMIGFPFGLGRLGEAEPAAAARVVVLPPGAPADERALGLTLDAPWDDPADVRVGWREELPLLHRARAGAPAALLADGSVVADVLGALEYLLEGEPRLVTTRDERGRFRAAYSVLDDLGLTYVAPLDRVALALRRALADRSPSLGAVGWEGGAAFLVALTHDVDGIFGARPQRRKLAHFLRAGLRTGSGLALERSVTEAARLVRRGVRRDVPAFDFGSWLAVEQRLGVRSTFHVFADTESGRDADDAWYSYGERGRLDHRVMSLGDALRTLVAAGFEVGLHTSIASFGDDARVARERVSVERASGAPVRSVRAHHLRFDPVRSPAGYVAAGLTQDASESGVGFVRGTAFPYALTPDGALLELPTVIQDDHLLKGWRLGLPSPLAERKAERVLGELAAMGGGATILFHADGDEKLPLYERLVGWIASHGGHCVTAAELAARWRRRATPRYGPPA